MVKLDLIYLTKIKNTLGIGVRLEIIRFLAKNYQLSIYTNQPELIAKEVPDANICIVENQKRELPIVSKLLLLKRLSRKLNDSNSEGVFMFHDTSGINFFLKKKKFIYTIQYGYRAKNFPNLRKKIIHNIEKFIELKGIKKADLNIVVSKPIEKYFKEQGINNTKFIYHAVDIQLFENPDLSNEQLNILKEKKQKGYFLVGYVGWVLENRGFKHMLDAIREVDSHKVILVIAGSNSEYKRRINEYAAKFLWQDRIINLGIVPREIVPGILHYCDVGLSLLDDIEAYRFSPPQKVVEYFAAGKPVICNNIQTHNYIVEHGKDGFIVEYTAKAIAVAIQRLYDDPALSEQMAQDIKRKVSNYDMKKVYESMIQLINKSLMYNNAKT